jgi:hypothetical protein
VGARPGQLAPTAMRPMAQQIARLRRVLNRDGATG